ncbi:glutathione S-transferase family protein [Thalassotalea mangrovi]|uniref:Glutathione S-transferase family protein n=1 Tax=Thalassotalea mangrovi TaxID=2572245 RepID=A0A4V5NVW0_9GAMM|nr:glutathione S-transferase family protein [Thalassotalea mangrovi]TKB43362.1 glutathione S-transferase family protein [Thalassotalea mangrovi]
MKIVLYEYAPTRSARVHWVLAELKIPYESRAAKSLFGSDELEKVHPLGKIPAMLVDGQPLIESVAMCTFLADSKPEGNLIPDTGTFQRAMHEQWCAFILSEVEAHLWSDARNTFVYPEKRRIQAIFKQNKYELSRSLAVLDGHLQKHPFMLGEQFSVTDIIVSFTTLWAEKTGHCSNFSAIKDYHQTLLAMDHCPYTAQ